MNIHKIQLTFFITFIAGALALNFFIFLPYFSIIFLAGIFAIIFEPLHKSILKFFGGRITISALFSVFMVLIFIFTPLVIFGLLLFQESSDVYIKISSGNSSLIEIANRGIQTTDDFIHGFFPKLSFDLKDHFNLNQYAGKFLGWLSNHLAIFFSSVLRGLIGFFLMILALFYFFRDGKRFIASLVALSPLFDVYDGKIISKIKLAVNSVIRGQLAISIIQGILTGVGFYLFDVPNPIIWASFAAVSSLIPSIGTSLVFIPAIAFLFFKNDMFGVVGLLIWGVCAVGLIDNFLGPILIERGVKIHPFLILLSVLGGIALFGPVGFVAGPVALSLLFALLDIYPVIIKPVQ